MAVIQTRDPDRTSYHSAQTKIFAFRPVDTESIVKEIVCRAALIAIEVIGRTVKFIRSAPSGYIYG